MLSINRMWYDGGMTEMIADGPAAARLCRYCGDANDPLPYAGQGRPPEYHTDPPWPGGKSCKQLAAAARTAEVAAGLDVPLASLRAVTPQLRPPVEDLAGRLAGVIAALDRVDAGAMTRV